MDLNLKTALASGLAPTFTVLRAELPGGAGTDVLRLVQAGQVQIGAESYIDEDARFGAIESVSSVSEGIDTQVTTAQVVFHAPSDAGVEILAAPRTQRSPITIHQGAVDPATGAVIGTELLFRGEINFSVVVATEHARQVRVELITEEARQLEANDERRLSHAFHQSIWPGELGLIHVTGVAQKDFWRIRKPSISYGGGGAGGSGGGGYAGGGGGSGGVENLYERAVW